MSKKHNFIGVDITNADCGEGEDGGGAEEDIRKHPGDAHGAGQGPFTHNLLEQGA